MSCLTSRYPHTFGHIVYKSELCVLHRPWLSAKQAFFNTIKALSHSIELYTVAPVRDEKHCGLTVCCLSRLTIPGCVCWVCCGCSQISSHGGREHDAPSSSMWVNVHVPYNVITMSRNTLSLFAFWHIHLFYFACFICNHEVLTHRLTVILTEEQQAWLVYKWCQTDWRKSISNILAIHKSHNVGTCPLYHIGTSKGSTSGLASQWR
jgi:hypothetical protein